MIKKNKLPLYLNRNISKTSDTNLEKKLDIKTLLFLLDFFISGNGKRVHKTQIIILVNGPLHFLDSN